MQSKNQTRWRVIFFGVFMSFIMVASLLSGWLLQLSQRLDLERQQRAAAEPTALPTFEPPVNTELITFDRQALQANGLFSVAVPTPPEWDAIESTYDAFSNRARLLMRDALNVIEASAEQPEQPVESLEALNELLNAQNLGASWRNYSNWNETQRLDTTINGNDAVQIDFELTFRSRTYLARQVSWFDEDTVYSVRVITPGNAIDFLLYTLDEVAGSFTVNEAFEGTPFDWSAYYDAALAHAVRYPQTWQLTDASEGLPASIESQGVTLRVEALDGTQISEDDAARFVESSVMFADEVLSVEPTTRGELEGFVVSYSSRDLDGEVGSGAVVLLNGDNALHMANLNLLGAEVDFNALPDEANADVTTAAQVLASFQPLSGVELAAFGTGAATPVTDEPPAQPNFGF